MIRVTVEYFNEDELDTPHLVMQQTLKEDGSTSPLRRDSMRQLPQAEESHMQNLILQLLHAASWAFVLLRRKP